MLRDWMKTPIESLTALRKRKEVDDINMDRNDDMHRWQYLREQDCCTNHGAQRKP